MNVDPDGHWSWSAFWKGVGVIVGTALFVAAIIASAAAVASTYVVATGVGLLGLSDSIEAFTGGFNPIRDCVMGGNQATYDIASGIFNAMGNIAVLAKIKGLKQGDFMLFNQKKMRIMSMKLTRKTSNGNGLGK